MNTNLIKRRTTLTLSLIALLAATGAHARATWKIGGESLLRWDHRDGATGASSSNDFVDNGLEANQYLYARTTLSLTVQGEESWSLEFTGRDNRTWDDNRHPSPRDDDFDLYTGSITLQSDTWRATLGRQEIGWGSWLAIGMPKFNNGQSFDALTVQRSIGDLTFQAAGGWKVGKDDGRFNSMLEGDRFAGVAADFGTAHQHHLYLFHRDTSPAVSGGARGISTLGWFVRGPLAEGWKYEFEAAYQTGAHRSASGNVDHRAWLAQGRVERTFADVSGKPTLAFEALYSPGDSDPTDGTVETWDLIYSGGNHKRGGYFDAISWRNQFALAVHGKWSPAPQWTLQAKLFRFALTTSEDGFYAQSGASPRGSNGYGIDPSLPTDLGYELDVWLTWKVNKQWTWVAEACQYFVGDYIEESLAGTSGARDAFYGSIRSSFTF